MPVWNPRANEIFADVLELPGPQRQGFLEQVCGSDRALRRQVEVLLAAHAQAGSFLDEPALAVRGEPLDLPTTAPDSLAPPLGASVLAVMRVSLPALPAVQLRPAEEEVLTPVVQPSSPEMPERPALTGRLQLHGEIARGGMGAVLKGRDADLGRDLAVKVLLEAHAGNAEMVRRFVEEAQIAGQLQHPGVAPVYELGMFADQRPYFTMKLVKGKTLAALLAERAGEKVSGPFLSTKRVLTPFHPLAPREDLPRFVGIFAQVCQTLAYAHARGVIHRDLKPANVMVGAFGEVQVMDWGLAKVLPEGGIEDERKAQQAAVSVIRTQRSGGSDTPEAGSRTQAGTALGTPAYMAPEQARGEVDLVDQHADVFGLGAILCEILTGQPPFTGKGPEATRKAQMGKVEDAFARLDACGADGKLVGLARRCLAAEPWERPRDAGKVAEELTAYQESVTQRLRAAELAQAAEEARAEEARATAAQERQARQAAQARAAAERRSRRLTVALAATVLLAVGVAGGGGLWLRASRDARQAKVSSDVHEALNQATAFRAQARAGGPGSQTLLAQAREQAERAAALAEHGPADEDLWDRVTTLREELAEEERDRRLFADLEAARLAQAGTDVARSLFTRERAVPLFREALRSYGLPVGEAEPAAVAERIRQRPAAVREALLAALDDWTDLAVDPRYRVAEPHLDWLRRVVAAAEPEGWGKELRAALAEKDEGRRRAALERLARGADVRKLPARALTRLASRLTDAGAGRTAVRLLRRAHRQYPADFWINQLLGQALKAQKPPELAEAVRYLTAAVALRPDSPGCYVNLAAALNQQGRVDEAIACNRKAIELDRKYTAAHVSLGLELQAKGETDAAIASYRKAVELDAKNAAVHLYLGRLLCDKKHDYDAAIACFRKAVELDVKQASVHLELGAMLCDKKHDYDAAIACFHKAIQLEAKNAWGHVNLGVALRGKGRMDEAIASYRKGIELDPKNAKGHSNLGAILCDVKHQYDAAIACFHRAIELEPKSAYLHVNLGIALRGKAQEDAAIAKALAGPFHTGAMLLRPTDQMNAAIACFRKAIELDPKYAPAHYNLGKAVHDKGQVDTAIACFRKAVELDPKLARAHHDLGQGLRDKGQVDEAIACFRKAIELDPKLAGAHIDLAAILFGWKRDYPAAIASYRKAIKLAPKVAALYRDLAVALSRNGQVDEAIGCYRQAIQLDPKDAVLYRDLGVALYDNGQVDEAIACHRQAIQLYPKYALAYNGLGIALARQGKLDEAIACYRQTIQLEPKFAMAHNNLAYALADQGKLDEAIACYRQVVKLDPKNAGAHFNLGSFLLKQGKLDEAIACYRQAIKVAPKLPVAHYNLGLALARQDKLDEAIACYRRAIELDPKFAYAHYGLGIALHKQRKLDEAVACYRQAIKLAPMYAPVHTDLGNALASQGKPDEAVACYRQAIKLAPMYAPAHTDLGNALARQGKPDEAIACYRQAIKLDPKNAMAHNKLGLALHEQRKLDEAIACYRLAIQLDPMYAPAHNNLGAALERQGKQDGAIACYRQAIKLDPKDALAHTNLGAALYEQDKQDEGIACFKKAIKLDPKYAPAHNNLGLALARQGKQDEAIACYRRAIELDPKNALAHNNLGLALIMQGKPDEAIAFCRLAIKLDPKLALAHINLARAERLAAVQGKLPAFLKGQYKSRSSQERLALAELCGIKKMHHARAGLYAEAFTTDPKLADDLQAAHRYYAACAAALAGCGQGKDADKLDDRARARWRKQALAWLRADLALRTKQLGSGRPDDRQEVADKMQHWQRDADFVGVRGKDGLAKLPASERAAWQQLWAEVKALREKASAKPPTRPGLDPKDAPAHNNLGLAFYKQGKLDEAIACYRQAVKLDPKNALAHYNLGNALSEQGKLDEAIACYRQAIKLDPKFAPAHYNLGNALSEQGKLDEAIACHRQAIKLDPKYAPAHYNLGLAFYKQGKLDQAIACYRQAIKLDPKFALARYNLGVALSKQGKLDEAIACYRQAINLDPKYAPTHINLGNALKDQGKLDEAITCYRHALQLDPRYAHQAHTGLGDVLAMQGKQEEAIACYRQAIKFDPKFAPAHAALGNVLTKQGKLDEAIACYHQAIKLDPKYALAHTGLGGALLRKGQFDAASACFRKALELGPKLAYIQNNLARAERLAAAQGKLAAFLKGEYKPGTNAQRLDLAELCAIKKLYRAGAGLYAEAFAEPKLADDLAAGYRYDAACAAAMAAAGKGKGAAKLDDKERAHLREQARSWLQADLALRTRQAASGKPADKVEVQAKLRHWQRDTDLASVRDKEALARLPEAERAKWQKLWAEVAVLLKKAEAKK
jgi:tetratricopeptide (TPR) repeat protein